MKKIVYAIEDDESIRELYECGFNHSDMECRTFESADAALEEAKIQPPDIFILDLMLPQKDGFTALKEIKQHFDIPVIIVSAKSEEISKVKGLNMGADDYLSKPFGLMELTARINANLRKYGKKTLLESGEIILNIDSHEVKVNGHSLNLANKEYTLLKLLMENEGKAVERDVILCKVWGFDYFGETRTLDMHIKFLRDKIAEYAKFNYLHTVRAVGYLFEKREQLPL